MEPIEREVVLCPKCKGVGKQYILNAKGQPKVDIITRQRAVKDCDFCSGRGNVIKVTYVEFYRFPEDEEKLKKKKGGLLGVFKK